MAELFSLEKVKEILNQFEETATDLVEETCGDIDLPAFMASGDERAVRKSINKIQNNLIASIPEGIPVPAVSLYVTPIGADAINMVSISVSSKFKAEKQFKFKESLTSRNADTAGALAVMMNIYKELLEDSMADSNLKAMNAVLEEAGKEAGLSYSVKIITPLGIKNKKVESLSNEEVVFVADMDRVFKFEDLLVLAEPVENLISEESIKEAFDNLVAELTGCQMPQQLVAAHGGVTIKYICNINKQVRPMTLIKKVCTKAHDRIIGKKDTLAYWTDDKSYALVVRRENGQFDMVLDPFDVETLLRSDVDVLAELNQGTTSEGTKAKSEE